MGPGVHRNADGRLELFVTGTDGAVYHKSQVVPNGGWSGWGSLGGASGSAPVVGRNADGRLEVFTNTGGTIYHVWQEPGGGWMTGCLQRHSVEINRPTVAPNADGRFGSLRPQQRVAGSDGSYIFHAWQFSTQYGGWSDWNMLQAS